MDDRQMIRSPSTKNKTLSASRIRTYALKEEQISNLSLSPLSYSALTLVDDLNYT